jgi:hypothetical protein
MLQLAVKPQALEGASPLLDQSFPTKKIYLEAVICVDKASAVVPPEVASLTRRRPSSLLAVAHWKLVKLAL